MRGRAWFVAGLLTVPAAALAAHTATRGIVELWWRWSA